MCSARAMWRRRSSSAVHLPQSGRATVLIPDAATPTFPGGAPLDAALLDAFAVEPSADVLRRLDERVSRYVMARQTTSGGAAARPPARPSPPPPLPPPPS